MNPNPTSTVSGKGRSERPKSTYVQNLIVRVRLRLDRLVSFASAQLNKMPILGTSLQLRVVWVLMIFVIGFAAGVTWESHGSVKGGTSSERLKAISLALSVARQNLDKAANETSKLEALGLNVPQRRSTR